MTIIKLSQYEVMGLGLGIYLVHGQTKQPNTKQSPKVTEMKSTKLFDRTNYASDEQMAKFKEIFIESVPPSQKEMMLDAWDLACKDNRMMAVPTMDYSPDCGVVNNPAIIKSVQSFLMSSLGRDKMRELAQKHSA